MALPPVPILPGSPAVGDEIARVYGWEIPNPKVKQKEAR